MSDTSAFGVGDLESALRNIDEQVARAQEHAAQMTTMAERVQGITREVESERGELTVTVDVSGRVTDIEFTERALSLGRKRLADTVLLTLRDAYRLVTDDMLQTASEFLPQESATLAEIKREATANAPRMRPVEEEGIRP